ncbi:ROK family transcriptional regulator [Microbacterium sp. STN6]|uniref:ROK family transcriptional regulator n=1 Tax=Microbacterium sp. STN6 TaxID=2995588 RepID=UPI00226101B5|nr:ROK family transcriptional regulator [Microbacterium sp. STN6]MCX7522488.1 ROK family transcriptional regulator [Microbacterium sp. STN6]
MATPTRRPSSRGRVLDLIRSAGPISRVEVAETTGLTQATISTVVRELLDDGLVVEAGRAESTGGKPRVRLEINPASRLGIGVNLSLESITYVVANLAGTIVGRQRVAGAGSDGPISVVPRMAADIASLIERLGLDRDAIVGIGLAAPGPIDRERGTITMAPALPDWNGFPVRSALSTATGYPCTLDNDADAAALGEYWLGATEGHSVYASIYMGTGIGSGIVIDGTIYRGASSNVGELGHLTVDATGPVCTCGNRGCLELYATPARVVEAAVLRAAEGELSLSLTGDVATDFATIATAAAHGDAVATELIESSAQYLAAAVVSLANLFDVELIVLAGSAFAAAGAVYVRYLSDALRTRALARLTHPVEVRASVNGYDAAAIGAATLVMQDRLSPRSLRAVTMTSA